MSNSERPSSGQVSLQKLWWSRNELCRWIITEMFWKRKVLGQQLLLLDGYKTVTSNTVMDWLWIFLVLLSIFFSVASLTRVKRHVLKRWGPFLVRPITATVPRKHFIQGSHSFTEKKSRTFPGLSRTPVRNFPGPFRSPWMLKYKEKTPFIHNIRSIVHCRNCSMGQNVESQRRQN